MCSGIVIFGAALCLAIGVPIALEMQSQQQPSGYRAEIVRKLLSEVPLVDGWEIIILLLFLGAYTK